MRKLLPFIALLFVLAAWQHKQPADMLYYNAHIYTVDSSFSVVEAMAVKDGKIVATGSSTALQDLYEPKEKTDAGGKYIYPGLIDAHAHFVGYALGLQTVDLVGTGSWQEILQKLTAFSKNIPSGDWLVGRGWDQNDWAVKEFPDKRQLDSLYPDRPVFLKRVDGHAAIVNQKALDIAGIRPGAHISGGEIEQKNGHLTGILIDNAVGLVGGHIPDPSPATAKAALLAAQRNCLAVGLTTVDDCGLDHEAIQFIDSLQKKGELKIRIYAMLSDRKKNFDFATSHGRIKTDRLNVRAFKVYADGALGSRGACLLQPYADKPGWQGFLLSAPAHFDSVAAVLSAMGFQMCTHAIGDSGNRTILHTYAKYLKGKNDLRWRIEHAQVIAPEDFTLFGQYNIVPSVQPTHATSDMYWAPARLGPERIKGAYAYKQLLDQNGWIPLGTDFPVEDISPLKTFYAAVVRKDAKGWPANGFETGNALSREETLRGMTIWAAKANFEEAEKGSLEKGKLADFIMTDRDLLHTPADSILHTRVLLTCIGGEKLHQARP
ncbi:MAG: amidohydrolase [Bacteroidetes bacterium]|nr:amidohydrolase [Bacteroidota bacterium]